MSYNPNEYHRDDERDYRERREAEHEREIEQDELLLREHLSEEESDLVEIANGWARAMPGGEAAEGGRKFHRRPMMPPDYIDPETGCTAAEMKEEETGWACPIEREIHDGVRTRRPLREDARFPKGKVA
jgi:hypothetical protein